MMMKIDSRTANEEYRCKRMQSIIMLFHVTAYLVPEHSKSGPSCSGRGHANSFGELRGRPSRH